MGSPSSQSVCIPRYQPLVIVLAAFCLGIVVDRFAGGPVAVWWLAALLAWLVWLVAWRRGLDSAAATLLLVAVAGTGAAWHHCRWNLFDRDELGRRAPERAQPVCLEAVALSGPRRVPAPPPDPMNTLPQPEQTQITVRAIRVRDGTTWRAASGKVNMTVQGRLAGLRAGDGIRVFGLLRRPAPPQNPGQFDFARHERTHRRLCRLRVGHPECVTLISTGRWLSLRRAIGHLRGRGDALLWKHIGAERGALASAVLLGAREQIDRERNEDFFTTGTVHLLAISGLHVGILAYLFWFVARTGLVARRWAIVATMLFVAVYALLTDARPPVVRATILILVFCTARLLGRQAFSFNTLAAAGMVVLVLSPAQLFQTGTQLSFLAVATLACCSRLLIAPAVQDPLDRLIAQTRPWPVRMSRRVGQAAWRLWLVGTCIWLVALPLVLYRFHLVSPVAVVLNPLLMAPIALALFAGFGVLALGWLVPPIGAALGWLCDANLWTLEACISTARPVSGSHFFLPAPAWWWVVGWYAGLGLLVALPRLRPPRRWCVALLAAWTAVGLFSTDGKRRVVGQNGPQLVCTFVAVGHGTSVVVELPDGGTLLYDAGHLGSPHSAARAVAGCLWSRGITHLDAVVLSHADADHYNALPQILERLSAGVVFVSPVMFRDETVSLRHLRRSIRRRGLPIRTVARGDRWHGNCGTSLQVLHPPRHTVFGSDNASSVVLLISFAHHRILLTGDLESAAVDRLLAREPLHCDVVMAPHHGSARSNPKGLARWSTPRWVVVSGGYGDRAGAVEQSYGQRGAEVLETARAGAIRVTVDAAGVRVRGWRTDRWK